MFPSHAWQMRGNVKSRMRNSSGLIVGNPMHLTEIPFRYILKAGFWVILNDNSGPRTRTFTKEAVMSTKSVCDMSYGAMHEFALVLDKAGFDADLVQKIVNSRRNKLAEAMYGVLTKDVRDRSTEPTDPPVSETEKFALLVDLDIITVPDDYNHAKQLATFTKKNRKKFHGFNDNIIDANFPNPSRILKSGDKFRVRAFKQIVGGSTTSEERMAFLAMQKAVHVGAQGLSLVFNQKRDQLPKYRWYASFDEKDRLWTDADGGHVVPGVNVNPDGGFDWRLVHFENVWRDDFAFLCFCDPPAGGSSLGA